MASDVAQADLERSHRENTPRDISFGPGIERDGDAAERMAFFGDKYLNLSVAKALERQPPDGDEGR